MVASSGQYAVYGGEVTNFDSDAVLFLVTKIGEPLSMPLRCNHYYWQGLERMRTT